MDRTEEETSELVREWLRRYGITIFLGIVIALAILFAMQWWNQRAENAGKQASEQLAQLQGQVESGAYEQADRLYQEMSDAPAVYHDLASLLMARSHLARQESDKALALLDQASHADDALVAQTARWLKAQQFVAQGEYDRARQLLNELQGSVFDGQTDQLRGDIFALQNDPAAALQSYQIAMDKLASPLLEMRINALKAQLASLQIASPPSAGK